MALITTISLWINSKVNKQFKGVFCMQQINCDASNCAHNKSGVCYSSRVGIGVLNVSSESETCCESFSNRALYRGLINNANSDSQCYGLTCEVEKCIHNANALCTLQSINVSGCRAQTYSQTICSSFDIQR